LQPSHAGLHLVVTQQLAAGNNPVGAVFDRLNDHPVDETDRASGEG
jgi:hypothetical protein